VAAVTEKRQIIKAMAVIRRARDGALLVSESADPLFQRPLGGHVEFGEYAVDTIHREFLEEIGQELTDVRLLGVLENIFPWRDGTEHEVVFIFAAAFADGMRRLVRFVAAHPELNQIMVHEGTAPSDRLTWLTETHVKPFFNGIRPAWQMLRDAGVAAPIDNEILYYVLIGAASLPYVNAAEVRLLTGRDPKSPTWIDAHADGLVSILLPGLAGL